MKSSLFRWMSGLFIAMSLSACGGGGGGGDNGSGSRLSASGNNSSPEGVYEGTSSTDMYFNTIILENNLFYTIYGEISNGIFLVNGFFTGTGQAKNGSFAANDVRDFDINGLDNIVTLSATYQPGQSFNGSSSNGTSSVTFTSAPPANTTYNYNTAANLSNIAGTWTMTSLTGENVSVNIAANGHYTANYDNGNCDFEGRISPRASGKNVFDVSVTGGGGADGFACNVVVPGTAAHAVEFLLPGGQRQLLIAGTDEIRENGTLLIGAR
ncbi:MAG: hypothetical protein ACO1NO_10550 [Burkholderiaceae bacterium]